MANYLKNQDDEVFSYIIGGLESLWTHPLQEKYSEKVFKSPDPMMGSLELFITPYCNQNCGYCYLQKNKEELYPSELTNNNLIIKNLKILLDYYTEKQYQIPRVDLFSGEIWGYPFGNRILDTLLEYLDKGLKINQVFIPTNASFCQSKELIKVMENYILLFRLKGCDLGISISYDGILIDSVNRPAINNKILNKENDYLNNLFSFAKRNDFGFHPMISHNLIEKQIDNYKTWITQLKKYWPKEEFEKTFGVIMQLETREKGWTDEKITEYLKWLKYVIDTDIKEYFNGDPKNFDKQALCHGYTGPSRFHETYMPYRLGQHGGLLGCSLGSLLIVRLGDLAIVPCHRLSYEHLILGNYKVENDKIIGYTAKNLPLTNSIYITGFENKGFCNSCILRGNCVKYCLGANYEANTEILYPEESNCTLQKVKVLFLAKYYTKLGIVETHPDLIQIEKNFIHEEPEVYKKWNSIIQQLI